MAVSLSLSSCLVHYPFAKENAFAIITPNNSLFECFPDKVQNLMGHEFTLLSYSNQILCTVVTGRLTGVYKRLFYYFFEKLNATYTTQVIPVCNQLFEMQLDPVKHLAANRFPYNKVTGSAQFDHLQAFEFYNVGILVTSNRMENVWMLMEQYFTSVHYLPLSIIVNVILFNLCVLGRRGWCLLRYNSVIAITMSQGTSDVQRSHQRKGARTVIGAIVVFNFLLAQFVCCNFTSKLMQFIPDHTINTFDDMMRERVRIFAELPLTCVLSHGDYELPKAFMNRIEMTNESLWTQEKVVPRSAYIVEMKVQERFLASGTNRNEYDQDKYFEIRDLIVSVPLINLFPVNSPFSRVFEMLNLHFYEAGLIEYSITQELAINREGGFKFFGADIRYSKAEPRPFTWEQIQFAFIILVIGWGVSCLGFLMELWWSNRKYGH